MSNGDNNETSPLRGLRYINLLRCSDSTQGDTSPNDQRTHNDAYARLNEMINVGEVIGAGVSASKTFNRIDLNDVFELRRKIDFEVVLVHDWSRFTRGGIKHGHEVEKEFKAAGMRVISVRDHVPEGELGELVKSIYHYKNHIQSEGNAAAVARGIFSSVEQRRRPATNIAPYGLDRLYRDRAGKRITLVCNIGMGVRVILDPETLTERTRLEGGTKDNPSRFHKQPGETSSLVLVADDRVSVLRWMFEKHYGELKWGAYIICAELNAREVPAPEGKQWFIATVRKILHNPIYLGTVAAFKRSRARFYKCSAFQPVPVHPDQDAAKRKGLTDLPLYLRDPSEWLIFDEPDLLNVIDDSKIRALARERFELEKKNISNPTTPRRDRHINSTYVLKGLLHSKQSDMRMRGETKGRKTYASRYYVVSKAAQCAFRETVLNNLIPADPIEQAIVHVVQEVLKTAQDISELTKQTILSYRSGLPERSVTRREIESEIEKRSKQIRLIYATAGDESELSMKEIVDEHARRLNVLRRELNDLEYKIEGEGPDASEIADSIAHQLKTFEATWSSLPAEQVRRLLATLIQNLRVDLVTREVEFEVAVPSWAMDRIDAITEFVGVNENTTRCIVPETHNNRDLKIDKYCCMQPKSKGCYICQRVPRAA